ncbi:MAG: tRNA (guanosine(37)-N1)-methyltransferase TrmD [Rickettsiales bacterium]
MWKAIFYTVEPGLYPGILGTSVVGRALNAQWTCHAVGLRDYATDKHRTIDDAPYGGGAGMVLKPDALGAAVEANFYAGVPLLHPSPRGERFTQKTAETLASGPGAAFICGRFEGVDERALVHYGAREVSLGDYVLSNGDLAAMAMVDAVVRLLPGALGNEKTLEEESFSGGDENFSGLLEYPLYTKPLVWKGMSPPETLRSGNHAEIRAWRRRMAEEVTKSRRPDLYQAYIEKI